MRPRVRWRLEASTNPANHYGRLTLSFDGKDVSFYIKNETAFELADLINDVGKSAWKAAINACSEQIDNLYSKDPS